MLTPLQRQLIELITSLPESAPFALAGGAALIGRGEVARTTEDLDYFAADREAVASLAAALEAALREAGLAVEVVQAGDGFVRMQVERGDERSQIDLAHDTRIREPEPSRVGTTVALEELAADKVLALFSRAEARDPDRFSELFRRRVAQLGLPPIRLHDLRHTRATLLLQAGVNPKVVSERLGHHAATPLERPPTDPEATRGQRRGADGPDLV